jgi:hypothetical protein
MECTSAAAQSWPAKEPTAKLDYAVDFTDHLVRWREARKPVVLATRVRAGGLPGFELECTTAGETGLRAPIWPKLVGATIADGSVVWTVRAVSTQSLVATISGTPTWTCADADLLITAEALDGQRATALLDGGIDGTDYEVIVTATAGATVIPVRCILPVRAARSACR